MSKGALLIKMHAWGSLECGLLIGLLGCLLMMPSAALRADADCGPPSGSTPVGGAPSALAVADFDRDGFPDLAVTTSNDNTNTHRVVILRGRGDRTLQAAGSYPVEPRPEGVAISDLDGDGKVDLAVAISGGFSTGYTPVYGTIAILRGRGDGTFGPSGSFAAGLSPSAVAVADFNADGKPDLAVANADSLAQIGTVSILLGNGGGTFQSPVAYPVGREPRSLAVGDFNADGKTDLAVANFGSVLYGVEDGGGVSVLRGLGDGTFAPTPSFEAGGHPRSVAVGDFNADGKMDLAVSNEYSNFVSTFRGNGDGTFAAAVNHTVGSGGAKAVTVGDFTGDGKPDLAVATANSIYYPYGTTEIFRPVAILGGNGDGTFGAAVSYGGALYPLAIVTADFNSDGRADLAIAEGSYDVSILLLGCGALLTPATPLGTHTSTATLPFPTATPTITPTPPPNSGKGFTLQSGGLVPGQPPPYGTTSGDHARQAVGPLSAVIPSLRPPFVGTGLAGAPPPLRTPVAGGPQDDRAVRPAMALDRILFWRPGSQTQSLLLRWSPQAGFTTLGVLPIGANGLPDSLLPTEPTSCYILFPFLGDIANKPQVTGISDLLCLYTGTAYGLAPSSFRVRLDESSVATLEWTGPGPQDRYELVRMRFDGPNPPATSLSADRVTHAEIITVPTCYTLAAYAGTTRLGGTDILCAVPGIGNIP